MALEAKHIETVVNTVAWDPDNDLGVDDLKEALKTVRPLLKLLWADIPWWKKAFIGLKALIGAIGDYLGEE